MRTGARVQAAIEILVDADARTRPLAHAIKDWMTSHRFAGSKDRAAIGDLAFAALRWKASSAYRLGADNPRAWVLGALRFGFGTPAEALEQMCYDDPHAPAPPTEAERAALARDNGLVGAPDPVAGDYPDWLGPSLTRAFGADAAAEGAALAAPAPLDLRANTLKSSREAVLAALARSPRLKRPPEPTPFAADGIRLAWKQGGAFPWNIEQSFQKGWYEVQDEGSQLAALCAGVTPGQQVADLCAGGGGKTLALAAAMANRGQLYAYDIDARRLAPLRERAERAGVRNLQIRSPRVPAEDLADLSGRMDVVLIDAPCTGSGTWRRAPDTKWRLRPTALAKRQQDQAAALALGAPLVKPGGVLVYVTCSVLPEENEDQVAAFLATNSDFAPAPIEAPAPHWTRALGLQFTPARTGTDGFYVARLRRV